MSPQPRHPVRARRREPAHGIRLARRRADRNPNSTVPGRGEGWFFSLGSGATGPLPPGAHQLTLPISENASVVKPGVACWVELAVTDRFTTTDYRLDFTGF